MSKTATPAQHHSDLLWQLTGARAGPVLLVTGDLDALGPVVERMQALPSLVYMRGTLKVGGHNAQEDADVVFELPSRDPTESYWLILTQAKGLGMISGRGIPTDLEAA